MATSSRRRAGRTLRRPRRRSAVSTGASTRATAGAGPLQAIGENTVVELGAEGPGASTTRFRAARASVDASAKKQSRRRSAAPKKKRKREAETAPLQTEKRRRQLGALLDELETQVQEKCDAMVAVAERRAQELQMELKVQLVYLPEAVRRMPWKTFVDDFGGDLQSVIHSLSQPSQSPVQPSPLHTRSGPRQSIVAATPVSGPEAEESGSEAEDEDSVYDNRNRRLSAFETPVDKRRAGEVPRTVLRTARKGETTYSARGSPILPDTVVKAPAGSLVATFDGGEPSTCLRLDSERVLDLSRPEELSAESRNEATSKLQALQEKVAQLLRQINPGSS